MVGIVDYGSGNFASVLNAMTTFHDNVKSIASPKDFVGCSHIVLPGVGAFKTAVEKMQALNLIDSLKESVLIQKKPFLGICVGMQILAEKGFEFEISDGLGWITGNVVKFDFGNEPLHLPHIGWNDVEDYDGQPLFRDIQDDDPSFYFVHSYHLQTNDPNCIVTYAGYGYRFPAAIQRDNIFGVQFHPEKSQTNGLQLLKNFARLNG